MLLKQCLALLYANFAVILKHALLSATTKNFPLQATADTGFMHDTNTL